MDSQDKPKKQLYKKWWFWVVIIFVLGVIGSIGDSSKPMVANSPTPVATEQPKAVIKVTALALSTAYKDNEVAADAKYKGQTVEITGTVDTIGKDILDTPYIALATTQYAIIDRVQCMFSKSDETQLATVSKGQNITLRGEVSGNSGNIIVNGCSIVQ